MRKVINYLIYLAKKNDNYAGVQIRLSTGESLDIEYSEIYNGDFKLNVSGVDLEKYNKDFNKFIDDEELYVFYDVNEFVDEFLKTILTIVDVDFYY